MKEMIPIRNATLNTDTVSGRDIKAAPIMPKPNAPMQIVDATFLINSQRFILFSSS
jgi:hypothetical protein